MYTRLRTIAPLKWIMLPLRLFLGVTFLYAGFQKLFNPQFFQPGTTQYIGTQITYFAAIPPLHVFLLNFVVPHALFWGSLILTGEIAIGIGVLLGFLFRPAVFFGLVLNMLFFLSVSWNVYPYFYGSDIVFLFCWLPLLLNGPLHTGLPTFDETWLLPRIQRLSLEKHARRVYVLSLLLGLPQTGNSQVSQPEESTRAESLSTTPPSQHKQPSRRLFLAGVLTGGLGTLVVVVLERGLQLLSSKGQTPVAASSFAPSIIAQAGSVELNSAVRFTIPPSENPGVLIHLPTGDFVAYNALCPHANCEVQYNPTSQLLICPCHDSTFDPSKKGAVLHPPATRALKEVALRVDAVSGTITIDR